MIRYCKTMFVLSNTNNRHTHTPILPTTPYLWEEKSDPPPPTPCLLLPSPLAPPYKGGEGVPTMS